MTIITHCTLEFFSPDFVAELAGGCFSKKEKYQTHTELETDKQKLRMVPGHFSPTSGLFSAMGYLKAKLLRFQAFI